MEKGVTEVVDGRAGAAVDWERGCLTCLVEDGMLRALDSDGRHLYREAVLGSSEVEGKLF